ncbi:MAG TPA: hypothetical protein VI997_12355 [Candidatus Thermoplasmatota archaeon]|nr:hypothetical protein [Candidatus Thermoplasmatota archaeon]
MPLDFSFHVVDLPLVLTLILLEGVLSFDNAAVLAAMVLRLPSEQRRKALLYGLVGAYVFRVAAILGVSFIIANPILRVAGGLYLVWLAVRHFLHRGHAHLAGRPPIRIFGLTAFWATVVAVEITDLAFALDQVLVAVAMTDRVLLIIMASMVAIGLLRLSAFYMTRLMTWFPTLEHLAYVAVGFVGLKLLIAVTGEYLGRDWHIPTPISIAVTLSLLVAPVVVKAVLELTRRDKAAQV